MSKPKYVLIIFLFSIATSTAFSQANLDQYLTAGNQMITAKDYNKAIPYFQAAIQIDPKNSAAYQGLGSAYLSLNRKPEALSAYEKASSLNPGNTQLAGMVQSLKNQGASNPNSSAAGGVISIPGQADFIEMNLMVGLAPGSTLSSGGTNIDFGVGFGGEASSFYFLDSHLGIGLQTGFYTFTRSVNVSGNYSSSYPTTISGTFNGTVNFDISSLELAAMFKYKLGGRDFWPYLLGGGGISLLMAGGSDNLNYSSGKPPFPPVSYGGSSSEFDPVVIGGGGLAFKITPQANLFLEARYEYIFSSGSFSFIPINIGANFNL